MSPRCSSALMVLRLADALITNVTERLLCRVLDFRVDLPPAEGLRSPMSRRSSDTLKANQYSLLVDWSDYSPFHRNHSGYRLIATRGWSLYVVDEVDGMMYVYDTEQWGEWIIRINTNLDELFAYSVRYFPSPLFADGRHRTLAAFLSKFE
jgi:hypothetical protein